MNKEKVFAWIESLEDMADQSDRYFVERTELYKENQEKDKEIERLDNIINELEKWLYLQILDAERCEVFEAKAYNNQLVEVYKRDKRQYNLILNKLKELKEKK